MPIGYIVGKQYRINTDYDRWSKLDIYQKILQVAGERGYSAFISYSHIGRNYTAEIKKHHRYAPKGDLYFISTALKNDASPLLALMAALRSAFEKDPVPFDAYMRVLFLEGEAAELTLTIAKVRAREEKAAALEKKLSDALTALRYVLDAIPVTFMHGDTVIGTHKIGDLRSKPFPASPLAFIENDAYASLAVERLKDNVTGKPMPLPAAPDEDDDL